jgi:NTP pyrophosphatase (non-canonical NTP hydrolase)
MDSKKFLEESERTVSDNYGEVSVRLTPPVLEFTGFNGEMHFVDTGGRKKAIDLLHAALGMQTESAEFSDMLKKSIFYGKPLDEVNLLEELGDQLWYISLALRALNSSFEEVMAKNIEKLKARYPHKFTEDKALNRDLDKEREILEKP